MQPNSPQGHYQAPQQPAQPQSYSTSKKQRSYFILFVLSAAVALVLLVTTVVFFGSQQDYKNNVDKKVAAGVADSEATISAAKDIELAEKEKQPYAIYNGPATFGSIGLTYPKTWSAYIDQKESSKTPISGYFHPNFVPGIDSGASIALTMIISDSSYDKAVASYESAIAKGDVTASPITLEKVTGVTGLRVTGKISREKTGTVVLLPIRDKTLTLTTESNEFLNDFNNIILKNITLVP